MEEDLWDYQLQERTYVVSISRPDASTRDSNTNTCWREFTRLPVVWNIWRHHLSSRVPSVTSVRVSVNVEWWMNIGEILIHPDFRLRGRSVMLIASLQRSPLVEAGRVETWSPLTSSADPDVTFTLIPVFLFCNTTCKRHREIKPLLLVGRFYPACLRVTCLLLDVGSITEKIAWIPLL